MHDTPIQTVAMSAQFADGSYRNLRRGFRHTMPGFCENAYANGQRACIFSDGTARVNHFSTNCFA